MSNILSDEIKQKFISAYLQQPIAIGTLCKEFNMCSVTASKILKQHNISLYTKQQLSNKCCKTDYFSVIDSEIKAYLLGILLSDGCIYHNNNADSYRVILELQNDDSYIIELFRREINSVNSIITDNRNNTLCYSFAITSNDMALDLISLGVAVGKINRTFPIVRQHLLPHLLRGIFDGDGCMSYRKAHPYGNAYRARVNIVGFENIINSIMCLYDIIGISKYTTHKDNSDLCYLNIYRNADIQLFYNYIYTNSNYYLHRKKEKFEQFFNLKFNI